MPAKLIETPATGLTVLPATQGNPYNCPGYESVNVWDVSGRRKYRTTVTVGSERLRGFPCSSARVEVWCLGVGWREVLTIGAHAALLDDMPTPQDVYTAQRDGGDAATDHVRGVELSLIEAAEKVL